MQRLERPSRWARRRWTYLAVATGFGVALLVAVPPSAGFGWGVAFHMTCTAGPPIYSEILWTPELIVSSPYGGSANATSTTFFGGWTGARNGSVLGVFVLHHWAISRTTSNLVLGPGWNDRCTSSVVALDDNLLHPERFPSVATEGVYLQGAGNHTDLGLPTSVNLSVENGTSYPSTTFDYRYVVGLSAPTYHRLQMCGSVAGGATLSTQSSTVKLGVPGTVDRTHIVVPVSMDFITNYTYTFPASAGIWTYIDLSTSAGRTGAGFSFAYSSC